MPELPEVQTIVNALQSGGRGATNIIGEMIQKVDVTWAKSIVTPSSNMVENTIKNETIQKISRRGKYILIELEIHKIIVHLRMSGDLLVLKKDQTNPKHTRVIFEFGSNRKLIFNNPRKFGRIWIVENEEAVLNNLGIEPLSNNFTSQWLYKKLQSYARQIKPLLLDQKFIAGLGNIYTDESLFLAKIHPKTISNQISREKAQALHAAIQKNLKDAIKRQGSSFDWMYQGGDFQNYFKVYQQAETPCPNCQSPIQRIVVGQRGTHICPTCQKIKTPE